MQADLQDTNCIDTCTFSQICIANPQRIWVKATARLLDLKFPCLTNCGVAVIFMSFWCLPFFKFLLILGCRTPTMEVTVYFVFFFICESPLACHVATKVRFAMYGVSTCALLRPFCRFSFNLVLMLLVQVLMHTSHYDHNVPNKWWRKKQSCTISQD